MSITTRRRSSGGIVDIWVTNNSDSAIVAGSLRNAIDSLTTLGLTNSPTIKFHPDFLDVAGTGANYTIVGTAIASPATVDNLTIDFSGINIIFAGTGGDFSAGGGLTSFFTNYKNAVIENQTVLNSLFGGNFVLDNIIFKNISSTSTNAIIEYGYGSIIRNCYFENVTKTAGGTIIFLNPNRYGIFENNVVKSVGTRNFFTTFSGAVINISKCYITTANANVCYASASGRYNFYQNYIEYLGTGNISVFGYQNTGDMINNTLVNIRVSGTGVYGAQTHIFAHNTQIYTRTLSGVLNGATLNGNVVKNNIIIAPATTNIFSTGVTYEESNNLYIAINANANFPNSTHYPASTPLSTLINTIKQGVGETNELYYLPTITNNVARLTDVLINQIYQDRTNPTNIGAI